MLTTLPLEASGFFFSEAVLAGVSSWMAGLVPPPPRSLRSSHLLFKVVKNQLCHILQKENIPYFRSNAVVSLKKNTTLFKDVKIVSRLQRWHFECHWSAALSEKEALRGFSFFLSFFLFFLFSFFYVYRFWKKENSKLPLSGFFSWFQSTTFFLFVLGQFLTPFAA